MSKPRKPRKGAAQPQQVLRIMPDGQHGLIDVRPTRGHRGVDHKALSDHWFAERDRIKNDPDLTLQEKMDILGHTPEKALDLAEKDKRSRHRKKGNEGGKRGRKPKVPDRDVCDAIERKRTMTTWVRPPSFHQVCCAVALKLGISVSTVQNVGKAYGLDRNWKRSKQAGGDTRNSPAH